MEGEIAKKPRDGKIKYWFSPTNEMFKKKELAPYVLDADDPKKRRVYIDRNAHILFVAHLDTVQPPRIDEITKDTIKGAGLDDRLGCFLAYKLSQEYEADLLLTDNEETGNSTAKYHKLKDGYHWIVEFDRRGEDVVTYGMESKRWLAALESCFEKVGFGSFSDISAMDTKLCAFNLGIGYENAHAINSSADRGQIARQLKRLRKFVETYRDEQFIADPKARQRTFIYTGVTTGWGYQHMCEICNIRFGTLIHGYRVCRVCFEEMWKEYEILRDLESRCGMAE